jgi:hypothetical protein
MKSEYKSGKSVGKNKTVPINVDDPRLDPLKAAITKARLGAEIEYIGIDSKGVLAGGSTNASGTTGGNANIGGVQNVPDIIFPPVNNQPPISYPGGSGPFIINLEDPSGLSAAWSGDILNVTFAWDSTLTANATASQFVIKLTTSGGATAYTPFNTFQISQQTPTGTSYTLGLTKTIITSMFNIWVTSFSQVCIEVADPNNNLNASGLICADISGITPHAFGVNKPHISLTSVSNGYKVAYGESSGTYGSGTADGTFPTSSSVDSVEIWELEGASTPTPTVTLDGTGTPTGWTRVYFGKLDPVNITSQNFNGRWIIARFKSLSAENTSFCDPAYILPTSPVTVNTKVPASVASINSAWSGSDLVLTYTLTGATATVTNVTGDGTTVTYTASNNFSAGNVVTITGVSPTAYNVSGVIVAATSTYFTLNGTTTTSYSSGGSASSTNNAGVRFLATLTAPTGAVGYFYVYPDGTGNLSQTATIKKTDLFGQFAAYFPIFTSGLFQSISIVDVKDGGVSFSVSAKTNQLANITPLPTVTAISNGYVVSWDITQAAGATKAEVYAQASSWALPTISTFSSTTTTLTFNFASSVASLLAPNQIFTVTGLSNSQFNNQFIAANVSGSTVTVTGTGYTTTSSTAGTGGSAEYNPIIDTTVVYQGQSPATIVDTTYAPVYIKVRYYDDYDSNAYDYGSKYSLQKTITAINTAVIPTGAPSAPSFSYGTRTSSTIPLTITTTDTSTTGFYIKYRVHGTTTYTTAAITNLATFTGSPSTSTNSYEISGLIPATQYDVNVGASNAYNAVSYNASDTSISTISQTISPVTGLTLTNEIYGIHAVWVAPASPAYPTAYYKVELYNNAAPTTVILSDNTYSTSYDFINLTSGTTYSVKVYTVDTYNGVSSAVTSTTLTVAPLSSTQATTILTNQLFALGGTNGTYAIALDGTGNGTTTPYKLYSGTGSYGATNTGFYLDSTGKFSLTDKLYFDGTTLTVNGTIQAQTGYFGGAISVNGNNGAFKIGPAAGGGSNNGIYINANNYWYDSGNLSIGASGNGVTWNGSALNVTGNIYAKGGSFSGNVAMVNAANGGAIYSGTSSASAITQIVGTGTTTATFTVSPAITLAANSQIYVNNLTNSAFNVIYTTGSAITSQTTFTATVINGVNLPTATLTSQAGTIIDITSGYILNPSNLAFKNTRLTSDNGGQLITTSAQIGGWSVGTNTIQNLGSAGSYVGINSLAAGPYSIWAGSQVSGGDISNFAVTPTGTVYARNLRISGGTLDVGGTSANTTATATSGASSITVASATGISAGMYIIGEGIPTPAFVGPLYTTGTSIPLVNAAGTSITTTATLSSTSVNFVSTNGAHISNSGILTATGANVSGTLNVTGSSTFGGNINVSTTGSIYSGTLVGSGSAGTVSNGYILNSNGIYFGNGSSTAILTASGGLVAGYGSIANWTIDSTGIHHVGANNTSGNIDLNNAGNISVRATNVSGYTAGINGAYVATGAALIDSITGTPSGVENVFWAGSGGATSTSNAFRVTLGGNLYASNASITGVVQTGNTLGGKITLDGNKDWASLSTTTGTSYIFPRNGNLYITSPAAVTPYSTAVAPGNPTATEGKSSPTGTPYFATGSAFKDSWGNTVSGIGLYTGNWDYFSAASGTAATSASKPFITTTTSGIQISGSADVGMIIEQGGATNDLFSTPTILMYTSKASAAPYAPSTLYGAWATFASSTINLSSSTNNFISLFGANATGLPTGATTNSIFIQAASGVYAVFNNSGIELHSGASRTASDSDYNSESYIKLGSGGTGLYAMPLQGDSTTLKGSSTQMSILDASHSHYANSSSLGAQPRQRMLVEDPISGQVKLGMAVYYQSGGSGPSNAGFVGDLWVQY